VKFLKKKVAAYRPENMVVIVTKTHSYWSQSINQ